MITQEIKLYEEPAPAPITNLYNNRYSSYYGDYDYARYTYLEVSEAIKKARDLGMVFGLKFRYKNNPNRIMTICGYESNTKNVYTSCGEAGVILARNMDDKTSATFHYSAAEILSTDNIEVIV